MHDNLWYDGKEQFKGIQTLDERTSIFDSQKCSRICPCILATPAFRLNEDDFKGAIQEGLTYICYIC